MKRLPSVFVGIVLLLGLASVSPAAQEGIFGQSIEVGPDATQDNIILLGGSARVQGTVRESVVAIGGRVEISGTVEDSVVSIGGTVVLKSTAVVKNDVVVFCGRLEKELGCTVGKDTVYIDCSRILPKFFKEGAGGLFGFSLVPLLILLKLVTVFLWFLVTMLVAGIFPRQVAFASAQVRKAFWSIFGTGFLGLIIFVGLTIISALLCLILIGIPILMTLIVAAIAIKVFGQIVLYHFFGESLLRAFNKRDPSVLGASLLGLLVVSLIGFIPILGWLFSFVLSIVGWGVAIRTKFGTAENWFARRQAQSPPAKP